ncbi:MAG: DNA polymerase III subunit delta [Treponema sp.]|jgi:DNA polymerase-3 subunit delta|nr:DNA polymerase III subunit delta [Treponema sp.]
MRNSKKGACWLFMGPEIGEKQAAIDEIRKNIGDSEAAGANSAVEETVFYAGETQLSAVVSALRNGSLFADTQLFFVKCADAIKKKEDVDLLAAYIAAPSDDTFLILVTEETSVAKALEQAISAAKKKIFWELSDSRKYEWVKTFFQKEGFKISNEGVETILEMVENNTAALKQECSRLILFLDKKSIVTDADVEKWLSHTREESAFTLFSRIASGDFSRSLECARILLAAKETPPAIFAGLASCFRKLISYLALKEAGVQDEWEYKKIGVSAPGAKRDYSAAARRYNCSSAETCLALTAEYDLLLRSAYSFSEQVLFDRYLYKVHNA